MSNRCALNTIEFVYNETSVITRHKAKGNGSDASRFALNFDDIHDYSIRHFHFKLVPHVNAV